MTRPLNTALDAVAQAEILALNLLDSIRDSRLQWKGVGSNSQTAELCDAKEMLRQLAARGLAIVEAQPFPQCIAAIEQALEDALCVIDGDSPEDISREEAEEDTRELIRRALDTHLPALKAYVPMEAQPGTVMVALTAEDERWLYREIDRIAYNGKDDARKVRAHRVLSQIERARTNHGV